MRRVRANQTRAAYDQIAARYAQANAAMPTELATAAARFRRLVGPEARVLDLGCGAGRDMAWLERLGLNIIGVDYSSGMLAHALVQANGPLLLMDIRHLGLRDLQFRGVWCCASLLHLPKSEAPQAFAEMRRVLVPGGVLFLSVQLGVGEVWERCSYADAERFFSRYEQSEMAALLSECGFTTIQSASNQGSARLWLQFFAIC
jgi:ubiquinone/menaquinone biosynthesis C-methylase UbiE